MAKKKTKQTPKDDLIESLMNDVQELSSQETQHGNAAADLFSNSDYDSEESSGLPPTPDVDFAAHLISEVGDDGDEDRLDHENASATELWQQVKQNQAPALKAVGGSAPLSTPESASSKHSPSEKSAEKVSAETSAPEVSSEMSAEIVPPPTPPMSESVMVIEESVSYPEGFQGFESADDKTMNLNEVQAAAIKAAPVTPASTPSDTNLDHDKTVAVAGFANRQPLQTPEVAAKVSLGSVRNSSSSGGSIYAASDATLAQSESLRLAQRRILELEKEVEKYRYENDELASAGEIIRERAENLNSKLSRLEGQKQEAIESLQNEILILKGNHQYKESELAKARLKIEELEGRLKSDFKKIRVRERELENRLELVKAEKSALLRAKDENILDLKRKIDHLQSELDNYRVKVLELNKTIDVNQEQFKRTVRALRLALSNLEVSGLETKDESAVPFKKAD